MFHAIDYACFLQHEYDTLLHMPKKDRLRRVVVALWTGNVSGRELLSGVLRYAQEHPFLSITLLQLPNDHNPTVDTIIAAGVDGIITSDLGNPDVRRIIAETDAQIVAIEDDSSRAGADARTDYLIRHNLSVGRLGGEYFLSAGRFNSYGFVGDIAPRTGDGPVRPCAREEGFRNALSEVGLACDSFLAYRARHAGNNIERLQDWIKGLPKPAAVMCFYDPYAVQVLQACSRLGLNVPTQVSVLGVDNDVMLCESATPPLSSIDPDHRAIGYQMARHLNALLHGRRIRDRSLPYSKDQVIVRESTRNAVPAATLVRRALDFISEHAAEGIGVDDVVSHLGVSQRLLFLRFRQIENRTIRDVIEECRIDLAAKRLRETNWTVARIARSCGYEHLQTFGTAFRRRFKTSPRQFRERNG